MGGNKGGFSGSSWLGVARAMLPGIAVPGLLIGLAATFLMLTGGSGQPEQQQSRVDADGRYQLVTPWNTVFDRAMLKGRPYLIWYGCTDCADGSADTLARMVRLRKASGQGDEAVRIVMITLDPQRDTPERLRQFVDHVGGGVIALTGNAEVVAQVADNAGIFVRRATMPGGALQIEHTSDVYLYDANDDFFARISPKDSDAAALAKLRGVFKIAPRNAETTPGGRSRKLS
ncbi:SCO family protein [Novosphingobium sp. ERN07]|uniref:SCO family protein n=1 Tax=Novosphingobium sp. ERN07 TaxID=2726187 RepID=UPI0014571B47|nr:SCO family protein [Novosphingobium sp. ERN07]NLR71182.1 SCO family protein [Novosphingobium sp. ERN07]